MKTDILNNIETDKTWIDVETVAKLKNISKRGVRLSLNSGKYEFKVEKSRLLTQSAFFLAGAEGIEPSARGFGVNVSINYNKLVYTF